MAIRQADVGVDRRQYSGRIWHASKETPQANSPRLSFPRPPCLVERDGWQIASLLECGLYFLAAFFPRSDEILLARIAVVVELPNVKPRFVQGPARQCPWIVVRQLFGPDLTRRGDAARPLLSPAASYVRKERVSGHVDLGFLLKR